ncbi:flagellar brake protein [Xylanivirga thermophila]|uniref:flagellar brake protein n=1 Tax=Xylanivirga thermophila TaxID=2496273 RepID=UPI00101C12E5|nr:PilZ domain-containing protein [Xylanivirga thermophila]
MKKIVNIGEKIEVVINQNTGSKTSYSMIQDILEDGDIVINMPVLNRYPVVLKAGDVITVIFFRPNGQFSFVAEVKAIIKHDAVYLVRISPKSNIIKSQRRNFYRLKTTAPISIFLLDQYGEPLDNGPVKGTTIDISGGGVKVLLNQEINKGSLINCQISLHDDRQIVVKGKVLRCNKVIEDSIEKYKIGICFLNISEMNRDSIVQYIFQQQMRLRRSGLA